MVEEGLDENQMSFVVFVSVIDFFTRKSKNKDSPYFLGDDPCFLWTSDVLFSMNLDGMAEKVTAKMREMAYLA